MNPESVGSDNAAAEPGNVVSAQRQALAARERAADERERLADERDRLAGEREREADERDSKANERDTAADERERRADEREWAADEREAALTERQQEIEECAAKVNRYQQAFGQAAETLERRTLETIERSRALLALHGERLNRQEAAVTRAQASAERNQAELARQETGTERDQIAMLPDPSERIGWGRTLREQARSALEALAVNEEDVAARHERLAARRPEQREEFRLTAEQARARARKIRGDLRTFPD